MSNNPSSSVHMASPEAVSHFQEIAKVAGVARPIVENFTVLGEVPAVTLRDTLRPLPPSKYRGGTVERKLVISTPYPS